MNASVVFSELTMLIVDCRQLSILSSAVYYGIIASEVTTLGWNVNVYIVIITSRTHWITSQTFSHAFLYPSYLDLKFCLLQKKQLEQDRILVT